MHGHKLGRRAPAVKKSNADMRAPPHVALVFGPNHAYSRQLLLGIGEYIRCEGPWTVTLAELGPHDPLPAWLERWRGDGIIMRGESRRVAESLRRLDVPSIDLTPSRLLPRAPWVKADDAAIARLAARHFLERGFKNFAFCGDDRFSWSIARGANFQEAVGVDSRSCDCFRPGASAQDNNAIIEEIGAWLADLPKPLAVFACNDHRGQQVLEACRKSNIAVPEQVAVLGVDNDEMLCALSPLPLSSVMLNPQSTAWKAAALLARMMRGETLPATSHFIEPVGIAARQSSDVVAVADAKIAAALRFIRENALHGIRVSDVLRHTPMARRTLEMRFRKLIGRTPSEEILRVRMNGARELLVGTTLPLSQVAERSGFEAHYLSVVFKQHTGMTPRVYRERYGRFGQVDSTGHAAHM
jgi:LacI family transcriptional regulator